MTWPDEIWIVVWEDPTTHSDWVSTKDAKAKKATLVISIGWGLDEDEDNYRMVLDWANDGDVHTVSVIPKRAVVRRFGVPIPKLLGPFLKKFLG